MPAELLGQGNYNKTCTQNQGLLCVKLGKALSAHSYSGLYPGKQEVAQMGTGTFPVRVAVGAQSEVTLECRAQCRATSDHPIERLNWSWPGEIHGRLHGVSERGVFFSPHVGPTRR